MSRYLANAGKASLTDRISGTMLMVLSTSAVLTLGGIIYLRKQGLIAERPEWVGSGKKVLTFSGAAQNAPAEQARFEERELQERRRRDLERRRARKEAEELAQREQEAQQKRAVAGWFSWWKS